MAHKLKVISRDVTNLTYSFWSKLMANQDDVFSISPSTINVGTSTGSYVGITCGSGVNSQILKYYSGGSLLVYGTTAAAAGASTGFAYLMGTSEALNIGGPAQYYLTATGATVVCMLIKTITAGN